MAKRRIYNERCWAEIVRRSLYGLKPNQENASIKYPVAVHHDKDSAYGVSVPDLPGC
ncbi:MAG: type II toxin-antitoxin system HicB family antitoxin [Chromatocurvus sp.]